jgi:hypothetical protein
MSRVAKKVESPNNLLFGLLLGLEQLSDAEIQSLLKAGRKDVLCDFRDDDRFKTKLRQISCP